MYLALFLYVVALIAFSYFFGKTNSDAEYLVAGRSVGILGIMSSKFAGAIGVSTFITYTGFAYQFGFGVFALLIGSVVGYFLFAFWAAPKANQLSVQYQATSQGDLVEALTKSRATKLVTNYISVGVNFFWVVLSLVGGAQVISYIGLLSYEMALVLTAGVVLLYVLISGFKAVIVTDIVQAFIIVIFLGLIVYSFHKDLLALPLAAIIVQKVELGKVLALLIYGSLSVFGMADRYQLSFAAKSTRTAKQGMSIAVFPVLFITFLLLLIGLLVLSQNPHLTPDEVFIYAMKNQLSENLLPVLVLLLFAGLMSSADTSIFAVASHFSTSISTRNLIGTTRLVTVFTVIAAVGVAFFWRNMVEITIVGAAMRLVLSVPMIYVLLNKTNKGRFIGSAIGGVLGLFIGMVFFGAEAKLVLTTIIGTLLGLLYKSKD